MGYLKAAFLVLFLFALTCGLCAAVVCMIQFSPLFGMFFLILGTLGVVLAADVLEIFFSN